MDEKVFFPKPLKVSKSFQVDVSDVTMMPGTWIQVRVPKSHNYDEYHIFEFMLDDDYNLRLRGTEAFQFDKFND